MVPTKCYCFEVLAEGFSGYYSTKNSISMSIVREKTSRSSDESQDMKLLSVVESQKPSDKDQESKYLSVVELPKSSIELPKSSIELPKPYNNNKEFKGFSGTADQRTGKTTP